MASPKTPRKAPKREKRDPLADFKMGLGDQLKNLITEAAAIQLKDIEDREERVTEREAKVERFLRNCNATGRITLQVGSVLYETTKETLLQPEDSYFRALFNQKFEQEHNDANAPIFIDRDGDVFQYVLEYLRYGQVYSILDDGMKAKLLAEADFFLLPELSELLEKSKSPTDQKRPWMSAGCSNLLTNGQHIDFNAPNKLPRTHFALQNGKVTIKQPGLYQIFVRYLSVCSSSGQGSSNVDLKVNNVVVARTYHGGSGYYLGSTLQHIQKCKADDVLECTYYSNYNGNPTSDPLGTSITIMLL